MLKVEFMEKQIKNRLLALAMNDNALDKKDLEGRLVTLKNNIPRYCGRSPLAYHNHGLPSNMHYLD